MFTDNSANKTVFPYIIKETLDSTNSYLKTLSSEVEPWTTVRALSQIAGRGRFNRIWEAEPSLDLTLSTITPIQENQIAILPSITPLVGISLLEACQQLGVTPTIKWPNDLLVDERKLSGILVEASSGSNGTWAVIGIGVNCNSRRLSQKSLNAISLYDILQDEVDIDQFVKVIMERVQSNFGRFQQEGFAPFQELYNKHLAWRGDMRCVRDNGENKYGIIQGVDATGALLFRHGESGIVEALTVGELQFFEE